jgi:hypothetical protein
MKLNKFKKRTEVYCKSIFAARSSKVKIAALVIWFQCLFGVSYAAHVAGAGLVLAGITLIHQVFGGETKVAYHMMIFDKTYTRKFFGVLVSDKYLMNVLHSQNIVYKHTYTIKFPDQTTPQTIETNNRWEFNQGGTEMGDHQIEVRDFVCKHGGDYGGMDIDLKVSFTMKVKWTTEAVHLLYNRARFTISGWDECPKDCTGRPEYNVGSLIDWSAQIPENGEAQVKVSSTKPSFKVNRSYGEGGSMAVTVN